MIVVLIFILALSAFSTTYSASLTGEGGTLEDIHKGEWFIEKKLVKLLTSSHDLTIIGRPVLNHTEPVVVEFGINLIQVLRVNEYSGQLITNLWTHYRWRDPSLSWNLSAVGLDMVRVPADEIWKPDITLFNYADYRMRQQRSTLAVVNSTGHVDWIPTGIFKSACSMDTFSFPFDEQLCYMTFRSQSMGIDQLNLRFVDNRPSMSLDSYIPNPEWEISENTALRSITEGKSGTKMKYYDLTFTLRLKRRSVFHRYVLVLPCVLLSLTAGVLFILPPESPAKIQIGIFIFQGFFLLLNLLKKSIPASGSKSPIIGLYFSTSMIATTIVMFACGFLVEIHFRADRKAPMSEKMRHIVIKTLAKYLFIPIPAKNPLDLKRDIDLKLQLAAKEGASNRGQPAVASRCATPMNRKQSPLEQLSFSNLQGRRCKTSQLIPISKSFSNFLRKGVAIAYHKGPADLIDDLIDLRKTFQRVADKQATKEYTECVRREWLIAIMVFDRIFFFLYITYIITSLYLLLPQEHVIQH